MAYSRSRQAPRSMGMLLLVVGLITLSSLPCFSADVPRSGQTQSNVDHGGLAKGDNPEIDSLVDEEKTLMDDEKLPSRSDSEDKSHEGLRQKSSDSLTGDIRQGASHAGHGKQEAEKRQQPAQNYKLPDRKSWNSPTHPDSGSTNLGSEKLDSQHGQVPKGVENGAKDHHDTKDAHVADQNLLQQHNEHPNARETHSDDSQRNRMEHYRVSGNDQQLKTDNAEQKRTTASMSDHANPMSDHAASGGAAPRDPRGDASRPTGKGDQPANLRQPEKQPIPAPEVHQSSASPNKLADQSELHEAVHDEKGSNSRVDGETSKSPVDQKGTMVQGESQAQGDMKNEGNKQATASAGTTPPKAQTGSSSSKNDPISMLITDIAPHKRKLNVGVEDGAKDPEMVNVESAREREINELLRRAEKYRFGIDATKINYAKALEAYSAAAKLGSHAATALLGEMYKHGLGVEPDLQKAISHFNASAEHGDPTAQRNLAMLYASGIGVEENQALAVLYYHFASISGDYLGQLAMGYRHMHGVGVPKNCQTAVEYYLPAVEAVVRDVQQFRPPPMMERYPLAQDAGGKTRAVDLDEDVVNYYQYSAARGDAAAQVALGQLYYFGARGIEQNYAEALRWYELAAEQGDPNALGHIGNMYVQGIHVEPNNETALKYFRQGAEKGNGIAINGLGYMHLYGMGLPQSSSEAVKLFSNAAEQGNLEARFNLGALYVGGQGVSKDYVKALYYFSLAANRGHMLALYNLAMMHLNGFGTPRSCPNAVQFLKSVAERGSWGLRIQNGYKLYRMGKIDPSFLLYSEASELGYEVAQANVAFLYDLEETRLTSGKRSKALNAFELSAQQGNSAAELKIGDYYYYGMGTSINFRKAVAHYRAASEARNAQAMFNLAFMHEHGIGLPKDLHLAKRFYDMAVETSQDALWPVMICRTKLWLEMTVQETIEMIDTLSHKLSQRYGPRYGLWLPASKVWIPWLLENWDYVLGGLLASLLLLAMILQQQLFSARMQGRR
uniref:Uncharacterized protein n=1 Tax=Guillardia theta TaxID=55529 RepID=A0A7S4UA39_GUITH|mmetsp:Transcript_45505/g.142909  ORF Transcript_45505/g.142909 Transcript_45505/m.142909 type:complete len:1010 (+) Transcript_45505:208-3237(+)